jgi:hypothetical protein
MIVYLYVLRCFKNDVVCMQSVLDRLNHHGRHHMGFAIGEKNKHYRTLCMISTPAVLAVTSMHKQPSPAASCTF